MSTALVLIDIQNDYFRNGAMKWVDMKCTADNTAQLLASV